MICSLLPFPHFWATKSKYINLAFIYPTLRLRNMENIKVSMSSKMPQITAWVFLGCQKKNRGKPASCSEHRNCQAKVHKLAFFKAFFCFFSRFLARLRGKRTRRRLPPILFPTPQEHPLSNMRRFRRRANFHIFHVSKPSKWNAKSKFSKYIYNDLIYRSWVHLLESADYGVHVFKCLAQLTLNTICARAWPGLVHDKR